VPIALPVANDTSPPPVKSVGAATVEPDTEIATALTPKLVEPGPVEEAPAEIVAAPPAPPPEPTELAAKSPPPTSAPGEVAVKAPPPPKVEKLPVAAGPAWRIQLVSLSSQKDAEAVWARMQKANADLLGKLKLQVQTVKLSKGTFYRVQAGPLVDRTAAASLCGSLKSRKQDCLVVAPK
jgi:cell division septation protein DedD